MISNSTYMFTAIINFHGRMEDVCSASHHKTVETYSLYYSSNVVVYLYISWVQYTYNMHVL